MKSIRASIIGLCIIICIRYIASTETTGWLRNFRSYITNDETVYQVMLLFEKTEKLDTRIEDIICSISGILSTMKIAFHAATYNKSQELSTLASFSSPQRTVIVIIHLSKDSSYMNQLNRPIEFVNQISDQRRRSRLLIILPEEQEPLTYVKLLRSLWIKQCVDVTILELTQEETDRVVYFPKSQTEVAILHQYNPFTKSYCKTRYAFTASWFPDKMRNLHGYPMKIGCFDDRPFVNIERDDTGKLQNVSGSDVELMKGLSEVINFKIIWISPKNETGWGGIDCQKRNSTGQMGRLLNNQIQLIVSQRGRFASCEEYLFEWGRGTRVVRMVMVVQISPDESIQLLFTWKKYNALVLVIMFLLIWILSHMLNFDRSTWGILPIMQLVLGFTAPQEPQKLGERIVFGSILVSCVLQSSFIYSAFADVSLAVTAERKLETVNQVLDSGLKPVLTKSLYMALIDQAEGNVEALLRKSTRLSDKQMCYDQLLKDKNTVLITRSDNAEWLIEYVKDSYGQPFLQIVDEGLTPVPIGLFLEPRSPYAGRLDEAMLKLIQSGVVDKWQRSRFGGYFHVKSTESSFTRGSESACFQKQLIYILIFGHVFATVIFFGEVLFAHLKNRVNSRKLR